MNTDFDIFKQAKNLMKSQEFYRKSKELIMRNELEQAQKVLEEVIGCIFPLTVSCRFQLACLLHSLAEKESDFCVITNLLENAISCGQEIENYITSTMPKRIILKKQQEKWNMLLDEIDIIPRSRERLGLILIQSGRDKDASHLLKEAGFTHRLSTNVLNYSQDGPDDLVLNGSESVFYATCFDEIINKKVIPRLRNFFSPNALFWKYHNYNEFESTGYFSYLYDLETIPTNLVEQVAQSIFTFIKSKFPEKAKRIKKAEWWAHCRPHNMGHQMHYDSENEGKGFVRHPIFSTVLYLSEDCHVGGPTFITNQLLSSSNLADKGWLIFPKENRMALFNASYLHGVIPGKGVTPNSKSRRITFMIGFWDDIDAIKGPSHGASRELSQKEEWLQEIECLHSEPIIPNDSINQVDAFPVGEVWLHNDGSSLDSTILPPYEHCFQGF